MKPKSRTEQVLAEPVGGEFVVYDQRTNEAHRLNGTAALVWQLADGRRTIPQIASQLRSTFDDADPAEADDVVRLALAELDRVGLVHPDVRAAGETIPRRSVLKTALRLIPVVATLTVPDPASAQTGGNACGVPLAMQGTYQSLSTPISSPVGACSYWSNTNFSGTINVSCNGTSLVITLSTNNQTALRSSTYTGTYNPADGTVFGSGTSSFPLQGCTANGVVNGHLTSSGGVSTIVLVESVTLSVCCTGSANYTWSGSH